LRTDSREESVSLKDVLVLAGIGTEVAGRYAIWLSGACGANVTAAAAALEPVLPVGLEAAVPEVVVRQLWEDSQRNADRALGGFLESASLAGVKVETLKFETPAARAASSFATLARCFDASILQQPDPTGVGAGEILEATLFGSGRPLIIVPYIHRSPKLERVLIAWDGQAPAARAVGDSLPFLALASQVEIVTSSSRGNGDPLVSGESLKRHLGRHGVTATTRTIPTEDIEVADMLLSYAADISADLMVMGGYGHSRMREFILGGTTRTILQSMTVPVLMSH
jgi:nucleotide-binding universal stress UspA family protein